MPRSPPKCVWSKANSQTVESYPTCVRDRKCPLACILCNKKKMKCTGEQDGCEECLYREVPCVYPKPKVGKLARSQRNVQQQPSAHPVRPLPPDNNGAVDASRSQAAEAQAVPDNNGAVNASRSQAAEAQAVPAGTFINTGINTLLADTSYSSGQGTAASSATRSDVDSSVDPVHALNPGSQEPLGTDLSPAPTAFEIEMLQCPTGPAESGFLSPPQEELDSQCVLACCQVATELERCNVTTVKSVQDILECVTKAVERLTDRVRLQKSPSFKCMAMFGVLAYQIIELLESGWTCFLYESKQNTASQALDIPSRLSLNMGPKAQLSWWYHIVLGEIRRTSELLREIKKLSAIGESGEREQGLNDLENWLQALSDKVNSHKLL